MTVLNSEKAVPSTPFSKFFRETRSREKKQVYKEVLARATERQVLVVERANKPKI